LIWTSIRQWPNCHLTPVRNYGKYILYLAGLVLTDVKKTGQKTNQKGKWQMNYRYLQPIYLYMEGFFILYLCLLIPLYVHTAMTEDHHRQKFLLQQESLNEQNINRVIYFREISRRKYIYVAHFRASKDLLRLLCCDMHDK
jgi:hypothetical protein